MFNPVNFYEYGVSNINTGVFQATIDTNKSTSKVVTVSFGNNLDYLINVNWGDGIITSTKDSVYSHTYASNGIYTYTATYYTDNGVVSLHHAVGGSFQKNKEKIISIDIWDFHKNLIDGGNFFRYCTNFDYSSIPTYVTFENVTIAGSMFSDSNISILPSFMNFDNVTNAVSMFARSSLSDVGGNNFNNVLNGGSMFTNCGLTTLTSEFENITNSQFMFSFSGIVSVENISFENVTSAASTFYRCRALTTLPTNMKLNNAIGVNQMFEDCTSLTDLPSGIKLSSISYATDFLKGVTINKTRYSKLLVDMRNSNTNNGVTFNGGNSKYDASAVSARAALVSRGWAITDGGYEA